MGIPIAVGGRSSSSRPIAPPAPVDEDADDGTHLEPVLVESCHGLAMAVDGRGLSATVSMSYYDLVRSDNNAIEVTVAELRVQLNPLARPYSSTHRDLIHRIRLPAPLDGLKSSRSCEMGPSIVFSSDGLFLVCLVPYPRHLQTAVVVFQLRKPRVVTSSNSNRPPPPKPSYLASSPPSLESFVPVATNPHIVTGADGSTVHDVTALCDARAFVGKNSKGPSVLLAGCRDGSVLAIAYRRALVAGVLEQTPFGGDTIISMKHITEQREHDGTFLGKLAIVRRNGTALVYVSHILLATTSVSEKLDGSAENRIGAPDTERARNGQNAHKAEHMKERSGDAKQESNSLFVKIDPLTVLMAPVGDTHPFVCVQWVCGKLLSLLVRPQENQHTAAQVWAIHDDRSAEPLSTLTMTSGRLQDDSHGSFLFDASPEDEKKLRKAARETITLGTCNLQYDDKTGCLAVGSVILSRKASTSHERGVKQGSTDCDRDQLIATPYVCVWHWLTNVVGLTLISREDYRSFLSSSRLFSQLFFARDKHSGNHLVHVTARLQTVNHSSIRVRKEVYRVGDLSPCESTQSSVCPVEEGSSLMLFSNSVTFPFVSNPVNSKDYEIEWKESVIPTSYTAAYGPPVIASIGKKRAVSIAVAASRGVCICDTTRMNRVVDNKFGTRCSQDGTRTRAILHPKWRLFGNEAEERGFRTVAMTWWEAHCVEQKDNGLSDDILLAVIQTEPDCSGLDQGDEGNPGLCLAGWSRRRLDFGGQLLNPVGSSAMRGNTSGIALPKGFTVSSLSILDEPHSTSPGHSRRALVLLSSCPDSSCPRGGFSYVAYRLQFVLDETDDKKFQILGKKCSGGDVKYERWTNGGVTSSVFLAGASFQYDLRREIPEESSDENEFVATLGVVRTPGYGLDSVTVTSSGPLSVSRVILDAAVHAQRAPSLQVSKYWLSDIVNGSRLRVEKPRPNVLQVDSFFVWAVELCDGGLLSWMVPYLDDRQEKIQSNAKGKRPVVLDKKSEKRFLESRVSLTPPLFVRRPLADEDLMNGMVCYIGNASDWVGDLSAANRREYALGCLPNSSFGCILTAGQVSRKCHRVVPGQFDSYLFAPNFLDHEMLGVGECILTPPAFVSSVFVSILAYEALKIGNLVAGNGEHPSVLVKHVNLKVLKIHALYRLRAGQSREAMVTGLRLLILRTVEILSREKTNVSGKNASSVAMSLFAALVEGVRLSVTPLEFASLFLGVGRQIEPHCFHTMFPLPLTVEQENDESLLQSLSKTVEVEKYDGQTVEDLYDTSIRNGSASISSSALPLCSSKPLSHERCIELLLHCLESLEWNTVNEISLQYDSSSEERQLVEDLFRFGAKLEDSNPVCKLHRTNHQEKDSTNLEKNSDETDIQEVPVTSASVGVQHEKEKVMPRNGEEIRDESTSVFKLFLPFLWGRERKKKQLEERAISEAASLFILSGFEDDDLGCLMPEDQNGSSDVEDLNAPAGTVALSRTKSNAATVAGMLSSFLLYHICTSQQSKVRWRKAVVLSQLVLGDRHCLSSLSAKVDSFQEVSRRVQFADLVEVVKSLDSEEHIFSDIDGSSQEEKMLVAKFLASQMLQCESEVNRHEASVSVDLILVLLSRRCSEIDSIVTGLLIVGVVFGHVAGRTTDFVDGSGETALGECYLLAKMNYRRQT